MSPLPQKPDFLNTRIAFGIKSGYALRRAMLLFSLLKYQRFVAVSKGFVRVALRLRLPVSFLLKPLIFRQFCGGETLQECLPVVEQLASAGVGSIPDFSVEGKSDEAAFGRVVEEVKGTIALASQHHHVTFAVFKPTGVAPFSLWERLSNEESDDIRSMKDYEVLLRRLDAIFTLASEKRVPVMIDAEETWIQEGIDRIVRHYSVRFNREHVIVYNTAQMYRTDRLAFIQRELELAEAGNYLLGYKLVRGAYHEQEVVRARQKGYPPPVFIRKSDTDDAFNSAVRFCFEHNQRIALCLATHNEESTHLLVDLLCQAAPLSGQPISFAQLYGMSDHITFNLAEAGYPVSKYLPYGPLREVIPYLFRRAEENRAVDGQAGRELKNLRDEWRRRKNTAK